MERMRSQLGVGLIALGIALLLASVYLAYQGFANYRPVMPGSNVLSSAITSATFELINLAGRLAFLGIIVWAASLALSTGVKLLRRVDAKELEKLLREYREKEAG